MTAGKYHVRVHLEPTPDVRSTLAALKISVIADDAPNPTPPFIAQLEAENSTAAVTAVKQALRRWGDVPVEPLGRR